MGGTTKAITGIALAPVTNGASLALTYDSYKDLKKDKKKAQANAATANQRAANAVGLPTGGNEQNAMKNIKHYSQQQSLLGAGYQDPYKKKTLLGG